MSETKTHAGPVRGKTWCGRKVKRGMKIGGIVTCKACLTAYRRDPSVAQRLPMRYREER